MQGMCPFVTERGLISGAQLAFLASSSNQIREYNFSTTDLNFISVAIIGSCNPNKLFLGV
jgi:hypothetical protein